MDFLSQGGEMGALTREHNWAATPLGSPETWPDALKTTLRLVLTSRHPMFVWWGSDLIQFYNDAYRQTMGPERHPSALGQRGRQCWEEIWPIIGPQIESVMAGGQATWHEEELVPVTRNGRREDVWWTYGYSPILDSEGPRGVLVVCQDVTSMRMARELLAQTNRHTALQLELADKLRGLDDPADIASAAFELLSRGARLAGVIYAEVDDRVSVFRVPFSWSAEGLDTIVGMSGALDDFGTEVVACLRDGKMVAVSDTQTDPLTAACAAFYARFSARGALLVPMIKNQRLVGVLSLLRQSARHWSQTKVALVESVAERLWSAMEQARARAQRLAAEQALIERRKAESERLRAMFQQAPGFMCVLRGPDHVFEFANAAYLRLVGNRDLLGKPAREAIPEAEGQGFYELLDRVFATGEPYSATDVPIALRRHPDEPVARAYIDFVYQPILGDDGEPAGIFVEGFDSTERRLAKAAMELSEERLKEGMVAARMVVWDWELATGKVHFSDNASEVFGANWTLIGEVWKSVPREDLERLSAALDPALATLGTYREVLRLIRPDNGETVWLQVHGKVIGDDKGEPRCVRGVSVDVSERKRAEEALCEADHRKDEFLAMLAHELRNPLAPISAAAQLLHVASSNPQIVRQTSKVIARQVEHMTGLINDMLDVSRVTTGLITLDKAPLDIKEVIADSVEQVRPFIAARQHHFTLSATPEPMQTLGDRNRLIQVITNLLQNAAKFTPEGGALTLSVEGRADDIQVSVRDSGVGMDAALLPHVFELFTQGMRSSDRSQGGLGLGLALVKSLVNLHGGSVTAWSAGPGKGSTFSFFLPRLAESSGGPPRAPASDSLPRMPKPLRLLVVDDNVDAARMLALYFESAGHTVAIEHEPYTALDHAIADPPDVCLLDIGLPGIDGNELARRLRSMPGTARTTLIAVTGYGHEHDREASIAAGFDYYFVKPADPAKLTDLMANIRPR